MSAYQFKVQLRGVTDPPIWRRLLVPCDYTFTDLALIIIILFEWDVTPFWDFSRNKRKDQPRVLIRRQNDPRDLMLKILDLPSTSSSEILGKRYDADETLLSDMPEIVPGGKINFSFINDGTNDHTITLEKVLDEEISIPVCLKGVGAPLPAVLGGCDCYNEYREELASDSLEVSEWADCEERLREFRNADGELDYTFKPEHLRRINETIKDHFTTPTGVLK